MSSFPLELSRITRRFKQGSDYLHVLNSVSLSLSPGKLTALVGPSGSGKSTLIRCINRLEEQQEGDIIVD